MSPREGIPDLVNNNLQTSSTLEVQAKENEITLLKKKLDVEIELRKEVQFTCNNLQRRLTELERERQKEKEAEKEKLENVCFLEVLKRLKEMENTIISLSARSDSQKHLPSLQKDELKEEHEETQQEPKKLTIFDPQTSGKHPEMLEKRVRRIDCRVDDISERTDKMHSLLLKILDKIDEGSKVKEREEIEREKDEKKAKKWFSRTTSVRRPKSDTENEESKPKAVDESKETVTVVEPKESNQDDQEKRISEMEKPTSMRKTEHNSKSQRRGWRKSTQLPFLRTLSHGALDKAQKVEGKKPVLKSSKKEELVPTQKPATAAALTTATAIEREEKKEKEKQQEKEKEEDKEKPKQDGDRDNNKEKPKEARREDNSREGEEKAEKQRPKQDGDRDSAKEKKEKPKETRKEDNAREEREKKQSTEMKAVEGKSKGKPRKRNRGKSRSASTSIIVAPVAAAAAGGEGGGRDGDGGGGGGEEPGRPVSVLSSAASSTFSPSQTLTYGEMSDEEKGLFSGLGQGAMKMMKSETNK